MAIGNPRDVVVIEWLDAGSHSESGWKSLDYIDNEAILCTTTGWIIKKTRLAVTVAASLNDAGQYDGDVTIPRRWIKRQYKWGDVVA